MKFNKVLIVGGLSAVMLSTFFSTVASAGNTGQSHSHDNESMPAQSMSQETMPHDSMDSNMVQSKMFLEKKDIDGYTVSFHVMKADEGMGHGGSHNMMIKVEQQGAMVKNLKINSKVVYPDGSDESKPLMVMGDWQMAGYDLKESGKHQLMVLFKTADGKKHFGGLYYGE
ncbi:hypothetical protein [Neptunomonas antarctica]|uniref:Copper(I)-binding protein n=1 Tax=Neptunomonas antarctica TaxID=619304 RepID=A0A1N7KVE4_9GAMM|nr:hypothetical protein [Neptunomonas antarctica]SIS65565.1 hypothetical protein SAMN05421760_1037 [Neptunomonas antarctica]